MPSFALYPIIVVIFGIGMPSLVVLAGTFCTIIIVSQTLVGLDGIDDSHHRLAKAIGLSYPRRLLRILLPGALPSLRGGIQLAANYAILVVVASEMLVGGASGLGSFTKRSFNSFRVVDTYSGILMVIILALGINTIVARATGRSGGGWKTAGLGRPKAAPNPDSSLLGRLGDYAFEKSLRWIVLPVAGLAAWAMLGLWLSENILPSPNTVIARMIEDMTSPTFQSQLFATINSLILAGLATIILGLSVSFMVGNSPYLTEVTYRSLLLLNGVPKILLYPFFLGAFGLGTMTVVSWSALAGSIPIILAILPAISNIESDRMKLGKAMQMSPGKFTRAITIPSVVPSLATGVRMGLSLSFIHVIFAEMFGARDGLGVVLANQSEFGRLSSMLSVTLIIALLALIPSAFLVALEQKAHRRFAPGVAP